MNDHIRATKLAYKWGAFGPYLGVIRYITNDKCDRAKKLLKKWEAIDAKS